MDFMQNSDGVAFDAMREGLVVTSPFSDDAAEVENWEEKAEEVDAPETSEEITGDELADYFMAEFLKGDGEGNGDDEPSLGRGVTLDLDIAKHMDRYHPEGITEKSTCKYIGNREGENDTPVDYYEKKGNIPTKDAFEWFSERYNISCYQPKTADDIKDLCLSSKRTEKLLKGRPLSKSEFDNTVLFLYRVCEDIKSRFPEVKFGIDFIYFWDDAPTNSGGTCTLDRREGIGYMFIGGSEALHKRQSLNYYHEDDRMLYDVIRHELGHSLSSSKIKREFNTLFSNERIEEYGRTKLAYDLATKVSLAAAGFLYIEGDRDKDIAKEECIAELFSVYTSPWYTKGTLPFGAEKFVEAMIKGEGLPMQIDMLQKTEDGFPNKGGKERRPEWIRGMEVIDPMPMRDYSKPFYTWDDYNEEWKYFNTTDERDRYNAWLEEKASRVSAEDKKIWIEEMCRCMKKKCNAQWQGMSNTAMDSVDKPNIFDPERFGQNSFEWGAIYWINQIRDAVEEFEDGYVIPDEEFIEMLRPLKKAAKVYAEAHGKDKAWVKNTVLSVPKAFANAFDTLSDGEGVSKEHFLKVLTVEGVCALAEGDIDSVHELENYYYRKGKYSPKGGYEVGRFVVIIKDPPSEHKESERIRRIIAIRGEKGDDDPTLVFWNTSKSGIVERKASQCSKPFQKCDEAYDWWFVENGDGARKVKNNPKAEEEKERGDEIYKAILSSMGITEDAEPDMADADFWAKHDKARHGGHFDPETMTCKLREKYEQGEKIENLRDEMDDIEVCDAPDVGASGNAGIGNVTPEEDAAYMEAVKRAKSMFVGCDIIVKDGHQGDDSGEGWGNKRQRIVVYPHGKDYGVEGPYGDGRWSRHAAQAWREGRIPEESLAARFNATGKHRKFMRLIISLCPDYNPEEWHHVGYTPSNEIEPPRVRFVPSPKGRLQDLMRFAIRNYLPTSGKEGDKIAYMEIKKLMAKKSDVTPEEKRQAARKILQGFGRTHSVPIETAEERNRFEKRLSELLHLQAKPRRNLYSADGTIVGEYDRDTKQIALFSGATIHTLVHELGGHATMQFAEQCAAAGNATLLKKINESIDTAPPEVWNRVRKSYHQLNNESDKDYEERLRDEVWAAVVEGKSKTIEEVKKTEKGQKWWKKAWNTVKACWAGVLGRMGVQVDWASDKVKNMSPSEFQEFIVKAVKEGRTLGNMKKGDNAYGSRQALETEDVPEQQQITRGTREDLNRYMRREAEILSTTIEQTKQDRPYLPSRNEKYTPEEILTFNKNAYASLRHMDEISSNKSTQKQNLVGNLLSLLEKIQKGKPVFPGGNPITPKNFITSLQALGFTRREGANSAYFSEKGNSTTRISNHAATAELFIQDGTHNNLSIVIKKPRIKKGFEASERVPLVEATYSKKNLEEHPEKLSQIIRDIGEFLCIGSYRDTAGADEYHFSGEEQYIKEAKDRLYKDALAREDYDMARRLKFGERKPRKENNPRSSVVKMAMGQDSADDRMVEFRDLLAKKFPDKDATAIISEIGKIKSAKEQENYIRRTLKGK